MKPGSFSTVQWNLNHFVRESLKYFVVSKYCARGQGSYFVRIRFSVNGELRVSCSDCLLITDMSQS